MANLNDIMDYLADNRTQYKDYSATMGTSQFSGWYYQDVDISDLSNKTLLGISVIYQGQNRPTIAEFLSDSVARVFCTNSGNVFKIRVLYRDN